MNLRVLLYMKGFNILLVIFAMVLSCKGQNSTEETKVEKIKFQSFGEKIEATKAFDSKKMLAEYTTMNEADTLKTKFMNSFNASIAARVAEEAKYESYRTYVRDNLDALLTI